jgi:hypothetical protein
MMTHDEMIAVIQAHKNGKIIQYLRPNGLFADTAVDPSWNFNRETYRIKPEPMVIFAEVCYFTGQVLRTSNRLLLHENDNTTIKKFIEAL